MATQFRMDSRRIPNGTVLLMGIRINSPDLTEEARDKVLSYAWLKAGGLWYGTGTGQVPQAAGWEAINRWLGKHNREVVYVDVVTSSQRIYEAAPEGSGSD